MDLDLFDSEESDADLRDVMVGPPVGGYIALWEEHDVSFWRLPGAPPSTLAVGALTRVEDETGRYRELGLLDRESGLLVLDDRELGPDGTPVSQLVALEPVTAEEAKAESVRDGVAAAEWLGDAAVAAAARGDWMAIHQGAWQGPFEPVVVVELLRGDSGEWLAAVRATPVPAGAAFWSDRPAEAGAECQQITAPASEKALGLAGPLAFTAFLAWEMHPLMLGITFGPNPLGPWSESTH